MPFGSSTLEKLWVTIGARTTGFAAASNQVGKAIGDIADKAAAAGRSLTAKVTLPLLGVGAVAGKAFGSFEQAITRATANTKDFADAQDELKAKAREVALATGRSATDVAKGYFFLQSAGLDAATSIGALRDTVNFAVAGQFDLSRAVDISTDALTALGLQSDDAVKNVEGLNRVMDVLVAANTRANASVEQFGEALINDAAGAGKQAGKEIEEIVAVLAVMADKGKKGAAAGTQLRIALTNLQTKALSNSAAFKKLNIDVFDGVGNMRHMADILKDMEDAFDGATAKTIAAGLAQLGFGEKTIQTISRLIGFSDRIRQLDKDFDSVGGKAADVAKKQLNTLSGAFSLVKAQVVDLAIGLGEALAPTLIKVGSAIIGVAKFIGSLVSGFNNWNETAKFITVSIVAMVASIGPLVLAFSALAKAIQLTAIGMEYLATVTAIAARHPIIALLTVIGGLVAGYYAWQKGSEALTSSLRTSKETIVGATKATQDFFAESTGFNKAAVRAQILERQAKALEGQIRSLGGTVGEVDITFAPTKRTTEIGELQAKLAAVKDELGRLTKAYFQFDKAQFDSANAGTLADDVREERIKSLREAISVFKLHGDEIEKHSLIVSAYEKQENQLLEALGSEHQLTKDAAEALKAAKASRDAYIESARRQAEEEERVATATEGMKKAVEDYEQVLQLINGTSHVTNDKVADYTDKLNAAKAALDAFYQEGLQAGLTEAQIQASESFLRLTEDITLWEQRLLESQNSFLVWHTQLRTQFASTQAVVNTFAKVGVGALQSFAKGTGQALGRAIAFGDDFGKAMDSLWRTIVANIIAALAQLLIEYAIFAVLNAVIGKSVAAGTVSAAAAEATATQTASAALAIGYPLSIVLAPLYGAGVGSALIAASAASFGAGLAFLNEGGLTKSEGLAYLHPGEIVGPVERVRDMISGGESISVTVMMDGEVVAQQTLPHIEKEIVMQIGADL